MGYYHKRGEWKINLFLSSIYHPVEHDEKNRFNKELVRFYNTITKKSGFLYRQDANANVGIQSTMFQDVLGHKGIGNSNVKGKDLLFLIKSNT